jgi:hypothetical protein
MSIDPALRDRLAALADEEYGGVSLSEALSRVLDERMVLAAIAETQRFRETNPDGWNEYLAEADELDAASAPVADEW